MSQLPAERSKMPMLLSVDGKIGPARYAALGLTLMTVKYGLDATVAAQIFHRPWPIWAYFMPGQSLDFVAMSAADRAFFLTLLTLSLPFIYVGVVLTMRRLRSAAIPVFWVKLFFVPFINVLLFLLLCVLPEQQTDSINVLSRQAAETKAAALPAGAAEIASRATDNQLVFSDEESNTRDAAYALVRTVPAALAFVWVGTFFLQSYGWGLFVGIPFVLGMTSAYLYGQKHEKSPQQSMTIAAVAITLVGLGIFLYAWEGIVCLLMAAPIAYGLALMGAWLGYSLQRRRPKQIESTLVVLLLCAATPSLMAAESITHGEAPLVSVKSRVCVDAPPAVVWKNVIAFPRLAEPSDPIFKIGIAYPIGATIKGTGVGAVRKCNFSTGAFVEPIRVWDEPHLLQFGVIAQPPSMREFSWLHEIHPAHLQGYLDVQSGQFLLTPVQRADGQTQTLLEGTTTYRNRMWPATYWTLWSHEIIHRIHMRVLEHIKRITEAP